MQQIPLDGGGRDKSRGWGRIASIAGRLPRPAPLPIPAGFADQVLARRAGREVILDMTLERGRAERLVLWAAGLSFAATLLLTIWNWPELQVAWSYPAPLVDTLVLVEPS